MPVVRAVFLSLLVHFLIMLGMALIPPDLGLRQKDVTEIELIPPPKTKNSRGPDRQIVRNPFKQETPKAPEDETLARLLSEQRNRVRKETQASRSGLTQNSQGNDPSKPARNQPRPRGEQRARDLEKEGFHAWNPAGDLRQLNRQRNGAAPSTVGDQLPTDVSVGSFTALNTDQYTYYTFYARIEELIRFRWESRVQNSIDSFDRATVLNTLGRRTWITNVEFLLSPDGRLVKSMVMKESGVPKFDMAAINAFKDAAMFPNPPQELVEEDGYIHLKYAFAVYFNPSVMVTR